MNTVREHANLNHCGRRLIIATTFSLPLLRCSTVLVHGGYPSPSPNFVPKRTYPLSFDQAWNSTLSAISRNQLVITSAVKEAGQITTQYKIASETPMGGGLLGVWTYRYSFKIFLSRRAVKTTDIQIVASITKQVGNQPPLGLDQEMEDQERSLERWLYEQIEQTA
jgi:hypothetical protein